MTTLTAYELQDLFDAMKMRLESELLSIISRANRLGELKELLRLLCMEDLLDDEAAVVRPTKILVIGDSVVAEPKLRSLAKKNGWDSRLFDFVLGYDELKHFNFAKLRNTYTYRVVLAGPMPHSTPGKLDASSAIVEMERHPEMYPPVIRLTDSTGLKITNNSFLRGLAAIA